jgi:hypothetical protein
LGKNKNDIIYVKNTGNVGINTDNPQATIEIKNNYGNINNIRSNKNVVYQSAQAIQTNTGNYITIYNTYQNNLYNLIASIYTINNDLVSEFTIIENSYVFINFTVDNLKDIEDKIVVVYSHFNNLAYVTESKVFNGQGVYQNINYKFTHDSLLQSSNPKVKSFQLSVNTTTGEKYNGYALVYLEKKENNTELKIDYLSNNSGNIVGSLEITNELNNYLQTTITNFKSIAEKNIKYHNIEYDRTNQKLIVSVSGSFKINLTDGNSAVYYLSFIIQNNLLYNTANLKPNIIVNAAFNTLSNSLTEELLGLKIKLQIANNQKYIYSYYLSNLTNITKIVRGEYNGNNGNFSNTSTLEDNLTENIPTQSYRYNHIPCIDIISETQYLLGYEKENTISYFNTETSTSTVISNFSKANSPFILSLLDTSNNYLNTLIFLNNEDTNNPYRFQSINFTEILGVSNFFSLQNSNNNIEIKNTGDITIQDIVTISKTKKSTEFEKLIVKTSTTAVSESNPGISGELRIFQNELYIFIANTWKKFTLTNI